MFNVLSSNQFHFAVVTSAKEFAKFSITNLSNEKCTSDTGAGVLYFDYE